MSIKITPSGIEIQLKIEYFNNTQNRMFIV